MNDIPAKAIRAYRQQRANAKRRSINWQFTFEEWWEIWSRSGKWSLRGRGNGYMMCRVGDAGPYSPGNVFIARGNINSSRADTKKNDFPIGVCTNGKGYRATRFFDGEWHHLGTFTTVEEAHAEYLRSGGVAS